MLVGGAMLVVGWLMTFAVVLGILPSYIWLNMVAYAITLVGFMIGIIGVVSQIRLNLSQDRQN